MSLKYESMSLKYEPSSEPLQVAEVMAATTPCMRLYSFLVPYHLTESSRVN